LDDDLRTRAARRQRKGVGAADIAARNQNVSNLPQSRAHGHILASKAALKSLRAAISRGASTPSTESPMRSLRPIAAILLALSLAACAAQSQPDLTPPPKAPLDAKTQLESGHH
jgi:hypothetical protein